MHKDLMATLAEGTVLLTDGAMGTELERRGVPMDSQSWSALAIELAPETIGLIHDDYVTAGADIHLTHTFPLARHTLEVIGRGDDAPSLNRLAVDLCQQSIHRLQDGRYRWIGGSVSNYRSFGNRYPLLDYPRLRESFDEQIEVLAMAGVDLIALEMLSDIEVSKVAISAALATELPVMIGITCEWGPDGQTIVTRGHSMNLQSEPTALEDLLPKLLESLNPKVERTILAIMHCDLDVSGPALDIAARQWSGPLAVYPNSGEIIPPNWQFETVCKPDKYAENALEWINRGATIVGGCCGIGPSHISELRAKLNDMKLS